MADDLYDRDFFAWTQEQARALRTRHGGTNALDYDNLAEEIEDVGKSELRACKSYLRRIIDHLLKLQLVGGADSAHWRKEVRAFRRDLADTVTASLRRSLESELPVLFAQALQDLREDYGLASDPADLQPYGWDQITGEGWYPQPPASA